MSPEAFSKNGFLPALGGLLLIPQRFTRLWRADKYQGGREVRTHGEAVTAEAGAAVTAIAEIHQYLED